MYIHIYMYHLSHNEVHLQRAPTASVERRRAIHSRMPGGACCRPKVENSSIARPASSHIMTLESDHLVHSSALSWHIICTVKGRCRFSGGEQSTLGCPEAPAKVVNLGRSTCHAISGRGDYAACGPGQKLLESDH